LSVRIGDWMIKSDACKKATLKTGKRGKNSGKGPFLRPIRGETASRRWPNSIEYLGKCSTG
jgi:hypothetical protein